MVKVLMFGWEFPPLSSGGLGTATYGLTKGLAEKGAEVVVVMPSEAPDINVPGNIKMISAGIKMIGIRSLMKPYMTSQSYSDSLKNNPKMKSLYGQNLFDEVYRYGEAAKDIAKEQTFDVIHAHDWMTFPAAMNAKKITKKPLVVHVHATELDRTGGHGVNDYVFNMEKLGMMMADKVIAVSNYTKNKIVQNYGINPSKIEVVHNAVEIQNNITAAKLSAKDKIVLYLGRITLQKGPEYFIRAAKKVLDVDPAVKFVIAGGGDMERRMIEEAAHLGIGDKVLFAGFLTGADIDRAYQMAQLYVMPSVSEPFGITPLESLKNGTPVLISKNSGVSEVLSNCLKVDFWDVNEMANKIFAVLNYPALKQELTNNGMDEVKKMSWTKSAEKVLGVYSQLLEYV